MSLAAPREGVKGLCNCPESSDSVLKCVGREDLQKTSSGIILLVERTKQEAQSP